MKRFWLIFLIFSAVSVTVRGQLKVRIDPSTPQCSRKGSTLICDFIDSSEIPSAYLGELAENRQNPIGKVYISNLSKVFVERSNCFDLVFTNVKEILFLDTSWCKKKLTSLILIDSNADRIPQQLSSLEVTRSSIKKLAADMGLQKLTLYSAEIEEFNMPWAIAGEVSLKIENSLIHKLTSIKMESKSHLIIMNSTIKKLTYGAIILGQGSSTTIIGSNLQGDDNSIILKSTAKLLLKNTEGRISMFASRTNADDYGAKRPPGVPQKSPLPVSPEEAMAIQREKDAEDCPPRISPFLWMFPTLVATIETFILIIILSKHFQLGKPKKILIPPEQDSEGGSMNYYGTTLNPNDQVQHYQDEGQMQQQSYNQMYRRRM